MPVLDVCSTNSIGSICNVQIIYNTDIVNYKLNLSA